MQRCPAPRVGRVDKVELLAVKQVLKQLRVVPQRRLVQQPLKFTEVYSLAILLSFSSIHCKCCPFNFSILKSFCPLLHIYFRCAAHMSPSDKEYETAYYHLMWEKGL